MSMFCSGPYESVENVSSGSPPSELASDPSTRTVFETYPQAGEGHELQY